jgi:NTE family protein
MTTLKAKQVEKKIQHGKQRPPFECIALVLQGGGALGSYQAGVYEALAEAELHPDWVAGISIGAINAAIIAGNAPYDRVSKLRGFWEHITAHPLLDMVASFEPITRGDLARSWFNELSAGMALLSGTAGFFEPRRPSALFHPQGHVAATSHYDTKKLKSTLERFVDFDRINSGETRFSVGAVNVQTGNFVYFDNEHDIIRAEHVMASGSLPPGFPAVEIDGQFYWDGGLVSNTPLQWVVDSVKRQDTLAFQVDLWSAQGSMPRNLKEVATRQKEIQFSSRTRANTDAFKNIQRIRNSLANLLPHLPPELQASADAEFLKTVADHKVYNIVQLIYRSKQYEGHSKDYEFSSLTMRDHWKSGLQDASFTLRHPQIFRRPTNRDGVLTFDLLKDAA